MEYTWENGVTTLTKNENFFYRAGAVLGSWSTSLPPCSWEVNSNKNGRFSTELGLCSPRGTSLSPCSWEVNSDKIGGDRTQMTLIYSIFADFFHGIHLGERSYYSN